MFDDGHIYKKKIKNLSQRVFHIVTKVSPNAQLKKWQEFLIESGDFLHKRQGITLLLTVFVKFDLSTVTNMMPSFET